MLLGRDGASDGELSLTGLSIDWPGKPRPDDGDSLSPCHPSLWYPPKQAISHKDQLIGLTQLNKQSSQKRSSYSFNPKM